MFQSITARERTAASNHYFRKGIVALAAWAIALAAISAKAEDDLYEENQGSSEVTLLPPVNEENRNSTFLRHPEQTADTAAAQPAPPSADDPLTTYSVTPASQPDQKQASSNQPAQASQGQANGQGPTLGEAPPRSNNLQFLRRQTVLLEPGDWQFDYGIMYSLFEDTFPVNILDVGGNLVAVVEGESKQRVAFIPFEYRRGVCDNVQLFCALPVGWANTEVAFPGSEDHDDTAGLGDLRAGASILLLEHEEYSPDLVTTLQFIAPTGDVGSSPIGTTPGAQLGEGYWGVAANLLWIHTIDPLVIFYGAGYRHRFDAELEGVNVTPGEEFNCQFGVGFAVNPNVTLSTSFLGSYISQFEANGVDLAGSALEIHRMRFSATIARCERILEPFAEIGMTEDAPSARMGLVWTY